MTTVNLNSEFDTFYPNAFTDCAMLENIGHKNSDGTYSLDNVTLIREYVFKGCRSFTVINLPNIIEIDKYGLYVGDNVLTSVTLGTKVAELIKLQTFILPENNSGCTLNLGPSFSSGAMNYETGEIINITGGVWTYNSMNNAPAFTFDVINQNVTN